MHYKRFYIPGATCFFTINLLNRKQNLLIEYIDKLKSAIHRTKELYPFQINAIVVMPEHMHLMITLPPDDDNYLKTLA